MLRQAAAQRVHEVLDQSVCVWGEGPASHRIILPEVNEGQAWRYLLDTCTPCLMSSGARIRYLGRSAGTGGAGYQALVAWRQCLTSVLRRECSTGHTSHL